MSQTGAGQSQQELAASNAVALPVWPSLEMNRAQGVQSRLSGGLEFKLFVAINQDLKAVCPIYTALPKPMFEELCFL